MRAGVIADFNAFEQLLRYFIVKALGSMNSLIKPTLKVLVTIPDFITEVEIRAIRDSMEHAGAREVFMIYSSHASVKGLGLDISDTFLLVDAGAGKISSSIFSDNMIYFSSRVDYGANKLKEVIDFYIWMHYKINCNDSIPEDILTNNLCFLDTPRLKTKHISGKDSQGFDKTVGIDLELLNNHLSPYYNIILDDIFMTILNYEKKYKKVINKIYLTGGLSKLSGFEKSLSEKISIPVINKSDSNYHTIGLEILDADFEGIPYAIR